MVEGLEDRAWGRPMIDFVRKMVRSVNRRVLLIATRGVVQLVDDKPKCQTVQVKGVADEVLDDVEHLQPYGLTSVPPEGSECLVISLGGNRSTSVVLACGDRRVRVTQLEAGELALYTDEGTQVLLRKGKKVQVLADHIDLGSASAADFVALAQKVLSELQKLQTHFNAVEAVISGPPIPEAGMGAPSSFQVALAAVVAASPYPAPASVAASKVKAD
jgi:phage baseplate assembly protein V